MVHRLAATTRLVGLAAFLAATKAFAYAPNFITKIIQEQTGIVPQGLALPPDTTSQTTDPMVVSTTTNNLASLPIIRPICTRFPPEPNGFLHLGHAKAVSFNFAVARMFGGSCTLRMDDTNPSKEDPVYVQSIQEDVKWIQSGLYEGDDKNNNNNNKPWEGNVRKTSDYFATIHACAVALIESGHAYVDSLSAKDMKDYRGTLTEKGRDSPYRCRSVEENLHLFASMRHGAHAEGTHVLRAKIDMTSPNLNLRDPTMYRIKHESHQETGDEWCIYPMYDFSHPISDAIERITHSLCSLEFEDHRPLYDWTIEKLLPTGLISCRPQQIEFSRLNIQSTVLSKRKLIQLVERGHVAGWDDPRLPTLSGLRRRGVSPEALRLFCERVGISKTDSNIDYSVLEDCVREIMDDTCPRAFGILNPLKITITNWEEGDLQNLQVPRHPKHDSMGTRTLPFGKQVFIERSDFVDVEGPEGQVTGGKPPKGFKRLLVGDNVRLRYAYVIRCDEVVRDPETQEPSELKCTYFPDTRAGVTPDNMDRVKGIIHWLEASTAVSCTINQYDRLFSTEFPGRDSGDFLSDINPESLHVINGAVVEPSLVTDTLTLLDQISRQSEDGLQKLYPSSLAYQFERSGYFALDKDSTGPEHLVFNRIVTLKDTWGSRKVEEQRTRGMSNVKVQESAAQSSSRPIEDIRRIELRAAKIISVERHPDAGNLLVCSVDCGDINGDGSIMPRTIVASLAGKVPLDGLEGCRVVAVTNLKPAKMRGIESSAMLLAASNRVEGPDETIEILQVSSDVPVGEVLNFEGKEPSQPDAMLKSKGALKAWERVRGGLRSNENGEAVYLDGGNIHRMMSSAGPIMTTSLKECVIQ